MLSTSMRRLVRVWTLFVLVFLYAPLLLVMLNAFNTSKTFAFPPSGFTLRWWGDAWASTCARETTCSGLHRVAPPTSMYSMRRTSAPSVRAKSSIGPIS